MALAYRSWRGFATLFFLDGNFVGDSDRKDNSDVYYIGNSSDNELFAEYLDDVRIYGSALSSSDVSKIYGGGFGDQFPSVVLEENSSRDSDPRLFRVQTGKDGSALNLTGFDAVDWNLSSGTVLDFNSSGLGESILQVDVNHSQESVTLSVPYGSAADADGKFLEGFQDDFLHHELVYREDALLSRWSFEESNGSRIRDRGLARNDGFLMGDAQLGPGKFGSGLVLDGSGDYLSIPRFRGIFDEGNFSISAWVLPGNLGLTNNSDDGGIFCSDSNGANTVLFWYNVNGSGTGNRTYTFNVGDTGIGLNRLDGPDGLAEEGRWQHLVAVMSGQQRSIYHNGLLVAQASGSDNLVTVEGSGVRLGSWNTTTDLDFEGNLDEVRLYNRSFGLADVAILYGNGNGDLGLTPIFTVDSNHSAATVQVRVDFKKFGIAQPISDFLEGDLSVSGGTVSNFSADANGAQPLSFLPTDFQLAQPLALRMEPYEAVSVNRLRYRIPSHINLPGRRS